MKNRFLFLLSGILIFTVSAAHATQAQAPAEVADPAAKLKVTQDPNKVTDYVQERLDVRKKQIAALDTNGDGVLDMAELKNSIDAKFNAADTDHDGFLSASEQSAIVSQFKTQNLYGDDTDSRADSLGNHFSTADDNHDGKLSKAEYEDYFWSRYKNFDRNGDGKIDEAEFRGDAEKVPHTYYDTDKK